MDVKYTDITFIAQAVRYGGGERKKKLQRRLS